MLCTKDFQALHCNFPTKEGSACCTAVVEGWATSCSHLFCKDHAQQWFAGDDRCPVCLDKEGRVRMVKVGAAKEKGKMHTLLIAHKPLDAQLAASTAINFWMEQKQEDFRQKLASVKDAEARVRQQVGAGRKKLAEAEALRQSLEAWTEELRLQLAEARQRLNASVSEMKKLESRRDQVQRAYNDTLTKAVGLAPRPTATSLSRRFQEEQSGYSKETFLQRMGEQAQRPAAWDRPVSRSPRLRDPSEQGHEQHRQAFRAGPGIPAYAAQRDF